MKVHTANSVGVGNGGGLRHRAINLPSSPSHTEMARIEKEVEAQANKDALKYTFLLMIIVGIMMIGGVYYKQISGSVIKYLGKFVCLLF